MTRIMIPYPDVNFDFNANQLSLNISSPWLNIIVKISEDYSSSIEQTLKELHSETPSSTALKFLEFFRSFPIWTLRPLNPIAIPQGYAPPIKTENTFTGTTRPKFKSNVLSLPTGQKSAQTWDIDNILRAAKFPDTQSYDPSVIYTEIRRRRLIAESAQEQNSKVTLNQLLIQNEIRFFEVVQRILHQTHYVTSHCLESLRPSLSLPENKETESLIRKYFASETGHHLLIERSLAGLGKKKVQPELVLNATRESMGLLKFAAENSVLAFSCMLEAFEGNSYQETDRLADLLLKSSKPESAEGLISHHKINRRENHGAIGLMILSKYETCDLQEALFAIETCNQLSDLGMTMQNDITFLMANIV